MVFIYASHFLGRRNGQKLTVGPEKARTKPRGLMAAGKLWFHKPNQTALGAAKDIAAKIKTIVRAVVNKTLNLATL
ncbi:MAG: hypothetical protein LBJ61_11120 [Deltaproteobacteria bacterium]|jgi:hypothetical protein|nr:hypothetical protein [Deltaproteobacteria bacterium]